MDQEVSKYGFTFKVAPGYEWFWKQFDEGTWEPKTFEIMKYFLRPDRDYFDIGAWIGPTVLFGSKHCKDVWAFEPDPVAYKALLANLELNEIPNCAALEAAAGTTNGKLLMGIKNQAGDSMSSVLWEKDAVEVTQVDVAALISLKNPNFIKMDIEGGEFHVLRHIKDSLLETKATLCLSLHTPWFANKEEYMGTIVDVLSAYPHLYDENAQEISFKDIPLDQFSVIIGTFEKI